MMEDRDIAELFLVDFISSLMEVKAPSGSLTSQPDIKENDFQMKESILKSKIEKNKKIKDSEFKNIQIKKVPLANTSQIDKQNRIVNKPMKLQKNRKHHLNYSILQNQISVTDKLNSLMRDPFVREIECLGADDSLIVQKSGMIQKTQIKLSIEEIYELIAEFSQKTRIPVINGRIKAALNDLIITAVLSETLGPRFIIQKKGQINNSVI